MQKVTPFLWFDGNAREAAEFYTSIFKDSRIVENRRDGEAEADATESVTSTTFEIAGQAFIAFNGGPEFRFSPAISLFVDCATQREVDELWERLSQGGATQRCGWLTDNTVCRGKSSHRFWATYCRTTMRESRASCKRCSPWKKSISKRCSRPIAARKDRPIVREIVRI